ncbi:HAMP domain-containing histidine kinase [Paenibacillus mendelii]|nr:HAMP domain-containing histidine kinase [Paenibacillus mendelii]
MDLRESNLLHNGTITLDGEWEFYPYRFIMEEAKPEGMTTEDSAFIQVPGNWQRSLSPDADSTYGYGSYRLRILVDPDDERLFSIDVNGIATSSKLYVNGRLLASTGQPAESQQTYKPGNRFYSAAFMSEDGEIDVVIEAANYVNGQFGGIVHSVKFGTERAVSGESRLALAMQFMVIVVLAIHAIYAVLVYLFGARDKVLLSFAVLVLCAMVMVLTDDDKLLQQWLPLNWEWTIKLQYMALIGIGVSLLKFARAQLPDYMPAGAYRIVQLLSAAAVLSILVLPPSAFLAVRLYYFLILLLAVSIFIQLTLRVVFAGIEDIIFLLFGAIAIALSCLGGLLKNQIWFEIGFYPVDILVAFLAAASFWFRRYHRSVALTKLLSSKLQKEVKRKDDFLANVSHELRNPLHGILNIAQSVLDTENNGLVEKDARKLELVVTVGRRMSFMLNDLLDLTLLKEKGIRLQVKPVHVQTVASGVIDMLRFMTEDKLIRFDNRIASAFPMVMADESRLIQILFNLLHNAVKYTNEGVITVVLRRRGRWPSSISRTPVLVWMKSSGIRYSSLMSKVTRESPRLAAESGWA